MSGYGFIGYGECNIDSYAKLGLVHTNPDPWSKRRLHAGNFFESGNGAEHRNFEMVRGDAPRVRHLWRDGSDGGAWHAAATLENPNDIAAGTGCVGQPACTSTTYNRNFEVVYWELSGRLRHWWMDQTVNTWHDVVCSVQPTPKGSLPSYKATMARRAITRWWFAGEAVCYSIGGARVHPLLPGTTAARSPTG